MVKVEANGRTELLTGTDNVPFTLSLTTEGGVAYLDRQRRRGGCDVRRSGCRVRGQGPLRCPEAVNGIVLSGKAAYDAGGVEPSMKSFHPKVSGARLHADALECVLG